MELCDIVRKAKKGNKEALLKLIMDKKDEYYRLAYTYMGNKEDSLDALQDMIVILFKNIKNLKKNSVFYSWSKTILVNCCKKMLLKNSKTVPLADNMETKSAKAVDNEAKLDIMYYLKKLSSKQQEAIKLKYFMGMDYRSIAAITKTPEGTVKSRVFNGIGKLKELIGGDYI